VLVHRPAALAEVDIGQRRVVRPARGDHHVVDRSRQAGVLPVVCPVPDDTDVAGIGIFAADLDEARQIMDDDPGVRAGVFSYELHPCRSLPGSTLPPR
jgi:hypothetical protein